MTIFTHDLRLKCSNLNASLIVIYFELLYCIHDCCRFSEGVAGSCFRFDDIYILNFFPEILPVLPAQNRHVKSSGFTENDSIIERNDVF